MNEEILRYSKQIILDDFGLEGQEKLKSSKILVVGAGGLGSSALYYLAAAGVGTIGIADFDSVALSNLNRQILHSTNDIGKKKTTSAKEKICALNPLIKVNVHSFRLNIDNISQTIEPYDIIIDATDNAPTRYLISDCCFFLRKYIIEGGAVGLEGFLMAIIPDQTACYRCLYPQPPKDGTINGCSDIGILGAVTGVIGSLMALEAIKLIIDIGEPLKNHALFFDGLKAGFEKITIEKNKACPLCGTKEITELSEYQIKCKPKF